MWAQRSHLSVHYLGLSMEELSLQSLEPISELSSLTTLSKFLTMEELAQQIASYSKSRAQRSNAESTAESKRQPVSQEKLSSSRKHPRKPLASTQLACLPSQKMVSQQLLHSPPLSMRLIGYLQQPDLVSKVMQAQLCWKSEVYCRRLFRFLQLKQFLK